MRKNDKLTFLFLLSFLFMLSLIPMSSNVQAEETSHYNGEIGDWYIGEVIKAGGIWEVGDQIKVEVIDKNISQVTGFLPTFWGIDLFGEVIWSNVSVKDALGSEFVYSYTDFCGLVNLTDPNIVNNFGGYLFNYTSQTPNAWYPNNHSLVNHSAWSFLNTYTGGINNSIAEYGTEPFQHVNFTWWQGNAEGDGLENNDQKYTWGTDYIKYIPTVALSWNWNTTHWNPSAAGMVLNGTSWVTISQGSADPSNPVMNILFIVSTIVVGTAIIGFAIGNRAGLSKISTWGFKLQ